MTKIEKILIPFMIVILMNVFFVSSAGNMDMSLEVTPITVSDMYGGDTHTINAIVSNDNWFCHIECEWETTQGLSGSIPRIEAGKEHPLSFDVTAPISGLSPKQIEFTVNCNAPSPTCGFSGSKSEYITLYFSYCGDSSCDSGDGETCSNCDSDCGCSNGYACVSGECELLCGNGALDNGETCSNCPQDVQCPSYERCQNGQCVTYCSNNRCDNNEDCSSCASDCACTGATRCEDGQCVLYCGNGICESNERVSCKADCDWCGDGTCQTDESCSDCEVDCGECAAFCGDNTCSSSESCSSCAKDCGVCEPYCGDGTCAPSESCKSCDKDCGECLTNKIDIKDESVENTLKSSVESETTARINDSIVSTDTRTIGQYYLQNIIAFNIIGGSILILIVLWLLRKRIKQIIKRSKRKQVISRKVNIKHCSKCGAKAVHDDIYCQKCGKKFRD